LVTSTTLGEGETADARYYQAMIDGSKTYRLRGQRGGAPFMEFTVYAGKVGLDEESSQVGAITEDELEVGEDGQYELLLSPNKQKGNWIKTTPDATLLYIRQYSHDWAKTQGATFDIERLDQTPSTTGQRPSLSLGEVQVALERTAAYVNRSVNIWAEIVDYRRSAPPNQFFIYEAEVEDPNDSPEMPTGHRFSSGYFRLAEDEALLVTFKPVVVPYWGLAYTNYWFEPLSYEDATPTLNNQTAVYEDDGSVRVIFASQNPGKPNWIDTKNHQEGPMIFRWSRTKEPVPELEAKVLKLADLEQTLNSL
jgi:hypothetical protein